MADLTNLDRSFLQLGGESELDVCRLELGGPLVSIAAFLLFDRPL